jgi:hypothetical protein
VTRGAREWSSGEALWTAAVVDGPESAIANFNLGVFPWCGTGGSRRPAVRVGRGDGAAPIRARLSR